MRKTNSESSLCNKVLISTRSLIDSAELALTLRQLLSSPMMTIWVTLLHAPPTWVLLWELQSTSDFPSSAWRRKSSKLSLISTTSRSEVSMESTLNPPNQFSISLTREDLADPRKISFKICTMESKPWSTRKSHSNEPLTIWLMSNESYFII